MIDFFDSRNHAATHFEPAAFATACIEAGQRLLLIDAADLPAEFFDLSTGVAGAFVQRVRNYGMRAAVVVPDRTMHSRSFQDFARESDRDPQFRFFTHRAAAVTWLTADAGGA